MRLRAKKYPVAVNPAAPMIDVNQSEVIAAFEGWIKGANDVDTMTFWRLINLELWMREFIDDHDEDADASAAAVAASRVSAANSASDTRSDTRRSRGAPACERSRPRSPE